MNISTAFPILGRYFVHNVFERLEYGVHALWKGLEKAYQQRQHQEGQNKGGEPPKEKAMLEGGGTTCQPQRQGGRNKGGEPAARKVWSAQNVQDKAE
jgi:hypothetical protein